MVGDEQQAGTRAQAVQRAEDRRVPDGVRDHAHVELGQARLVVAAAGALVPALGSLGGETPQAPAATTPVAPGPSREDMAAAAQMSEKDRGDMIRGMVERLAGRLKENAGDIDGWQRLLRAYMVLGEREKAQGAAADARKAFADDADKLRRIDETIKSLGLTAQAG